MHFISDTLSRMKTKTAQAGFTMIELLIVISILGILAVAVLSAINPVEQINRGRDTGTRSDAEQLLSAIDRFNAFQGFFPWQENAGSSNTGVAMGIISTTFPTTNVGTTPCPTLTRLAEGVANTPCIGAQELKSSFIARLATSPGARPMYVYNAGTQGASTYICFVPQSNAFLQEATTRCATTGGIPSDLSVMTTVVCDGPSPTTTGRTTAALMSQFAGKGAAICLP